MVDVVCDVATPKQAIFATYLLRELTRRKLSVEIIAKKQTQTFDLLNLLKTPFTSIGEYGEGTLDGKITAEIKRTHELIQHFHGNPPRVWWTHAEVSGVRFAFALNIPIVYSYDTIKNTSVVRLTVPLVNRLIIPDAYKKIEWAKFGIPKEKITSFHGIEEVAWAKDVKPDRKEILKKVLGKEAVDRLVVVRGMEYKASYALGVKINILRILKELPKLATVVYLQRYEEEKPPKGFFLPKEVPYGPELVAIADLVIGSGGTLCRESALLGTPTIDFYFHDHIAKYLIARGFSLEYIPDLRDVLERAKEILREPDKYRIDTRKKLDDLESPIPIIIRHIQEEMP